MAEQNLHPGIYINEIESPVRPLSSVGTSTIVFVGQAQKGTPDTATLITSWAGFTTEFGTDFVGLLPYAVFYALNLGAKRIYVIKVDGTLAHEHLLKTASPTSTAIITVTAQASGVLGEDIEIAYSSSTKILTVTNGTTIESYTLSTGVASEAITALAGSDLVTAVLTGTGSDVIETLATTALAGGVAPAKADFLGDEDDRTGIYALTGIDEVMTVSFPDAADILSDTNLALLYTDVIGYAANRKDLFVLEDCVKATDPTDAKTYFDGLTASDYAAKYYPWITASDPVGTTILVPPSIFVAGCIARVDAEKGFWVTPAGTDFSLAGASDVETNVTDGEQDILNPANINCIRKFTGYGVVIWGGRTSSTDSNKKYITVRRTLIAVEKTVLLGTKWVVFKPNDANLWRKIRISLSNYLTGLWSAGGLKGSTPAEAFYIKCDGELNTQAIIDEGKVLIECGIAAQKPGEFVIFSIGIWYAGQATTVTE